MGVSRGARLCVLGLALAAAAAAGAFPIAYADDAPPIPPGTVGIRLLEAPASRLDDPRALDYVVDHVHPGASFARSIQVSNGIDGPIRFDMLAGAATIGGYGWSAQPFAANELTSWITLDPAHLTVPPGGSQVVVARFAVPQDASDGERFAALFAVTAPSAGDGNVQTRSAVGIRVYLDVGRGGEPASSFTATDLRAQAGAILAAVTNTGERALDVAGGLTLQEGPGGASAGPFDGQAVTLAVGTSGTVVRPRPHGSSSGPMARHAGPSVRSRLADPGGDADLPRHREAASARDPRTTPCTRGGPGRAGCPCAGRRVAPGTAAPDPPTVAPRRGGVDPGLTEWWFGRSSRPWDARPVTASSRRGYGTSRRSRRTAPPRR
jgi:hypothetical protein